MLAMNSDLYFDETASWLTFSSTRRLDSFDLLVLLLRHDVLLGEQPCLPAEVLVGLAQLFLLRAELFGLGLGLLEQGLGERVASIVLRTMPMLSVTESRNVWWVMLNGENEASSMTARKRPFEQHRQDDDVERWRLSQPRVDPHVVARNVREQDALLLLGALADQTFTEPEGRREMLPLFVPVAGLELQHRIGIV